MILWVFGGTCVGKKRFIERAVNPKTRPAYLEIPSRLWTVWINDGHLVQDIVSMSAESNLIVRWQWGRDEVMESICQNHPDVRQAIVYLSVSLMTQLSRIALREGSLKWDVEQVHGEQLNIMERIHELSARYDIPVFHVDASNDDYLLRKRVG